MFRISPSQLDSFAYYLSVEDSEKSDAVRQEMLDSLRGIKVANEAMQAGIDFETDVFNYAQGIYEAGKNDKYNACVAECAENIYGSIYQYHVERVIDGVCIHGVIDFLNRNNITDLKACDSYSIGKYQERSQHLIYLACLEDFGIDHFTYLVSDFRNVYKEDYVWQPTMLDTLRGRITRFFDYLENDVEMKTAFEAKDHNKQTWQDAILLKGDLHAVQS